MTLPPLYPILDTTAAARCACTPLEAATAWLEAGVEILQLRHKGPLTREVFDLAAALAELTRGRATFVVNDRADLAALFDAVLHLGQDDLPPAAAHRLAPRIGYSTHTAAQLAAANAEPVVYHALGPVFGTASKENPDAAIGLDQWRAWRPLSQRPLVAIGGITLETAPALREAGADSLAVIGALLPPGATAAQIGEIAREWLHRVR